MAIETSDHFVSNPPEPYSVQRLATTLDELAIQLLDVACVPEISGKPITPAQIRAIHVALSRNGIDDDEYRERLRRGWGVASSKELSRKQASGLLRSLGVPLKNPPGTRPPRPKPERPPTLPDNVLRLATPEQRRLITELAMEIDWREEDGFERWLRHNLSIDNVRSAADAVLVIEGLKGMARRQRASE